MEKNSILDLYKALEIAETEWPSYNDDPYEFAKSIKLCIPLVDIQTVLSDSTMPFKG